MDMGLRREVEMGLSEGLISHSAGHTDSLPKEAILGNSTLPAEQFVLEAQRLADEIRLALSCDLSVATKKAVRLSFVLTTKGRPYQRSEPARGGLSPWQKAKMEAHIADRLDRPLPISDLAKVTGLSASYFFRAFKESFGEAPHAYVMRMRISRAQTLMATTTDTISGIALMCGFGDQAHLCRCFRRITGQTPGYWRRQSAGPWPPPPQSAIADLRAQQGCGRVEAA